MMLCKSNFRQIKTSVLGLLIIGATIGYVFTIESANPWIFGILLVVGISMLFLPDTLIDSIKKLLTTNSEKKF